MKITGFKQWLNRRAVDAAKRAIGFAAPGRVHAALPSPVKLQDLGTVANWTASLRKANQNRLRSRLSL